MTRFNPVQQQVLQLAEEYAAFGADPDARLLIWSVDDDTQKMIQTMLTFHMEDTALFPDLVLQVTEPPTDIRVYDVLVMRLLAYDFDISREDLEEPIKSWNIRAAYKQAMGDPLPLIAFLAYLQKTLSKTVRHVTLYIHPALIEDTAKLADWLEERLEHLKNPNVRLMVFDDANGTLLQTFAKREDSKVMIRKPLADVNTMMEKTLEATNKDVDPGPQKEFRNHMVYAVTALRRQDYEKAFSRAQEAFRIAKRENWPDMMMTSLLVYGNAVLAKKEFEHVIRAAKQAQEIGEKNAEHPNKMMIDNLVLQACFLEANAHVVETQWKPALAVYLEAAKKAESLGQVLLEFEARRMATFCSIKMEDGKQAWEHGQEAITVAHKLPEQIRSEGTFLHLAKDLKPVAQGNDDNNALFEAQMKQLLGHDWEAILAA